MHEMSITESILAVALEEAQKYGDRKIRSLTLRIGKLRQIVPETLYFCFDVVSQGTPAEGARLDIEEIPVYAYCESCEREFEVEDFLFVCPHCGLGHVTMTQGDELILANMELE